MALENADYISQLSSADPKGADFLTQGDNHIRLLKEVLQNTFPGYDEAVNVTPAMLNAAFANVIDDSVDETPGFQTTAFTELGTDPGQIPKAEEVELLGAGGAPVGSIYMWPLASPPSKHLICNGQAVSRTTYADLFAVYGTTFGAGDGTNTFNLPDWRSRGPIGAGQGTDLSNRVLNEEGGAEEHTLTSEEMPAHKHKLLADITNSKGHPSPASQPTWPMSRSMQDGGGDDYEVRVRETPLPSLAPSEEVGEDEPHNNMQPYVATNFIVRALK